MIKKVNHKSFLSFGLSLHFVKRKFIEHLKEKTLINGIVEPRLAVIVEEKHYVVFTTIYLVKEEISNILGTDD